MSTLIHRREPRPVNNRIRLDATAEPLYGNGGTHPLASFRDEVGFNVTFRYHTLHCLFPCFMGPSLIWWPIGLIN